MSMMERFDALFQDELSMMECAEHLARIDDTLIKLIGLCGAKALNRQMREEFNEMKTQPAQSLGE